MCNNRCNGCNFCGGNNRCGNNRVRRAFRQGFAEGFRVGYQEGFRDGFRARRNSGFASLAEFNEFDFDDNDDWGCN